MGDVPYRIPEDYVRFEQLIETINRESRALVLHIGDIKSGSTPCSDTSYLKVRAFFDKIAAPLLYTPGDNEWTDCHRPSAGAMDPIERLTSIRRLFFSGSQSLGQTAVSLTRQSDISGATPYPENARTELAGVTILTAHVVGSNNNLRQGHPAAIEEHLARNQATADWIRAGFTTALARQSVAVVIAMHADPFDRGNGLPGPSNRSGFAETLAAIADGALRFRGPVLVIHGDSHVYRVDQPFRTESGDPLPNVTRLEVFGAPTVAAVAVTVMPGTDMPFRIRPLTIPDAVPGSDLR